MPANERIAWGGAAAVAAVVVLLVVGLSGLGSKSDISGAGPNGAGLPLGAPVATSSVISLSQLTQAEEGDVVTEEAVFLDPSPLFLPTKWNSDQKTLPSSILRDPGQMFADFAPRLIFSRNGLEMTFPSQVGVPTVPADVISGVAEMVRLAGLGRRDDRVTALAGRGGYVEVVSTSDGRRWIEEALPTADLGADIWRPLELAVAINAGGVVGSLSVIRSSGVDRVDEHYRAQLSRGLHLGERLPPGFYRVLVGP
ncbi:MAG: hypothetical protein RIS54_1365 [Verrucomicrobiota bacterium]